MTGWYPVVLKNLDQLLSSVALLGNWSPESGMKLTKVREHLNAAHEELCLARASLIGEMIAEEQKEATYETK